MKSKLSHSLLKARWEFFMEHDYICYYCGNELWDLMRSLKEPEKFKEFEKQFSYSYEGWDNRVFIIPPHHLATIDHVIPLFLGGEDSLENMVPACKHCNCKKGWRG